MPYKPNILIINPDRMRADTLHHLGCEASYTPNLDELCFDGVSFRNAFCQNPVCVPSRCSFMTGLYPHTKGHRTMSYIFHEDAEYSPRLLLQMKEDGTHTKAAMIRFKDYKYVMRLYEKDEFLQNNIASVGIPLFVGKLATGAISLTGKTTSQFIDMVKRKFKL